jgi:hypothetical protein
MKCTALRAGSDPLRAEFYIDILPHLPANPLASPKNRGGLFARLRTRMERVSIAALPRVLKPPRKGEVDCRRQAGEVPLRTPSPAGDSQWWYDTVTPQIPQDSARYPLTGIALFAVKKGQKPPAIPRCWTHGQRNVRVPLESSGRSVALRISSRLQGRTCEAFLRVSPAMHNAPTRCALDFESATPRICNASASLEASPLGEVARRS